MYSSSLALGLGRRRELAGAAPDPSLGTAGWLVSGQFLCPAGLWCDAGLADEPDATAHACWPGAFCPLGTPYPLPCPEGTYNPFAGAASNASCLACPAGAYCLANASAPTGLCPPGFFCPGSVGAASCVPLPAAAFAFLGNAASVSSFTVANPGGLSYTYDAYGSPNNATLLASGARLTYLGSTAGLPSGNAPRSLAAWLRCAAAPNAAASTGYAKVLGFGAEGAASAPGSFSGLYLRVANSEVGLTGWGAGCGAFNVDLCDGLWHHLAGTYTGVSAAVYVDGALAAACGSLGGQATALNTSASPPVYVGWNGNLGLGGGELYSGAIAGARIFALALSAAQVATDATLACPLPCPSKTYRDTAGATQAADCALCPSGAYCLAASTVPTPCPPGFFCPTNIDTPTPCPAGTFSNHTGVKRVEDCTACLPGRYCSATGLAAPQGLCAPGYYCLAGSNTSSEAGARGGVCRGGGRCRGGGLGNESSMRVFPRHAAWPPALQRLRAARAAPSSSAARVPAGATVPRAPRSQRPAPSARTQT